MKKYVTEDRMISPFFIKLSLNMKLAAFTILILAFQSVSSNVLALGNFSMGHENSSAEKVLLEQEEQSNHIQITKLQSSQQQKSVTGTVTDEAGLILPGVTIHIKGTTKGTVTNTDGNYTISDIPENATLVFSFVGMLTKEIEVGNQTTINITMVNDAIGIDEVIAVGYGTMKKSDLTGSVVRANIDAFKESPSVSILQSLQGSVSGLNVGMPTKAGEDISFSIRGQNSISGSNSPLIVIDGVIFNGLLVDINPNDIETVDVLKDASSTAIYGSRAANGVIILTTKAGGKSKKPIISYSSYYSIQQPAMNLTPLNRDEYINKISDVYWEEAFIGPDYTEPNPSWDPSQKMLEDGIINGYNNGTETDWLDVISQQSYIHNQNLSIQGKTNETSYFISSNITKQHGFIINDNYKRWSTRINIDNQITNWLKIGIQSFLNSSDYSGVSPSLRDGYLSPSIIGVYDENGDLIKQPAPPIYNPLLNIGNDDVDKRLNLFGNFYALIDNLPIKGLSYKVNFVQNYRIDNKYNFNPNGAVFQGAAYKKYRNYYDWSFDNIVSYKKSFLEKHDIEATLVYGREHREGEGTDAESSLFTNMDLGYNSLEGGAVEKQLTSSEAWEENSLYYMGRINYKFDNKYLFTGTIRRDGFSGFGENKKFGIFPSASVAWIASEENFIKDNTTWLDYLKVRGSYGLSGNRTIGRYSTLAKVSSDYVYLFGDGGAPATGQYIKSMANSDLGWESTIGLNIGLDFALANNRIHGNVEYYKTNTSDLIYEINIPFATGFSAINTNIGEIQNNGIEFSITTTNIKSNDFQWKTTFNYSRNRNKVVSILGIDDDEDGIEDDLVGSNIFMGESLGSIYYYQIDGLYQLDDQDIPSGYFPGTYKLSDISGPDGEPDGIISAAYDREIIGTSKAAYRFSIQNEFKYKNWTLRAFINSIQGGKNMYLANNKPYAQGAWTGDSNVAKWNLVKEWNYWTPTNQNADYRRLDRAGAIDPYIYKQRNFVRLQDVSLSYNFESSLLNKLNISHLKLFASGKNLYTWTKWKGLDPETGKGIRLGEYPVLKSYTFGLELTF